MKKFFTNVDSLVKFGIILAPNRGMASNDEIVVEQIQKIDNLVNNNDTDIKISESVKVALLNWKKDWERHNRFHRSFSYGNTSTRKGAPAAQIAKKSLKAEKDRQIRQQMKSAKGGH